MSELADAEHVGAWADSSVGESENTAEFDEGKECKARPRSGNKRHKPQSTHQFLFISSSGRMATHRKRQKCRSEQEAKKSKQILRASLHHCGFSCPRLRANLIWQFSKLGVERTYPEPSSLARSQLVAPQKNYVKFFFCQKLWLQKCTFWRSVPRPGK